MDLPTPAARLAPWLMAALIACTGDAYAEPSRPFKGSLDLEHRIGRTTRCFGTDGQPAPGGTFSGTGHATHLGSVELQSTHCLAFKQDDSVYVSNGTMRLTAANGDVVLADYAGFFTPVTPGVYSFEGTYYIDGGTGRFEDASGTGPLFGTLQGEFTTVMQLLSMSAEGRIKY